MAHNLVFSELEFVMWMSDFRRPRWKHGSYIAKLANAAAPSGKAAIAGLRAKIAQSGNTLTGKHSFQVLPEIISNLPEQFFWQVRWRRANNLFSAESRSLATGSFILKL